MKISSYSNIRNPIDSDIFVYQENMDQKLKLSETLQKNELLMEVLNKKYYETLENGPDLDSEEVIEEEWLEISNL